MQNLNYYIKYSLISFSVNKTLFLLVNIITIILGLGATRFFGFWIIVEINILRFIIILTLWKKNNFLRIAYYFLPQAIASSILFFSFFIFHKINLIDWVLQFRLILKIGLAPFHMWFIVISTKVSNLIFFFLSVTQKIIPFFLLILFNNLLTKFTILISIIISTFRGLKQNQIILIIRFSSIFSACWILSSNRFKTGICYLLIYAISLIILLNFITHLNWQFLDAITIRTSLNIFVIIAVIFNFMGMPPLFGFFIKIIIAQEIILINIFVTAFLLILFSFLYFIIYLKFLIVNLNYSNMFFLSTYHLALSNTIWVAFLLLPMLRII